MAVSRSMARNSARADSGHINVINFSGPNFLTRLRNYLNHARLEGAVRHRCQRSCL